MKIKTLVCSCKGLQASRNDAMNAVELVMESDLDGSNARLKFTVEGGTQILQEVVQAAEEDSDTYVLIRCDMEEFRIKLLQNVLPNPRPGDGNSGPVDRRFMNDDGMLARISQRLAEVAALRLRN